VGALGANAYRSRPRTTEDIDFLVGEEAFQRHAGGFVTLRVPVSTAAQLEQGQKISINAGSAK